ncbi:DNA gyrase inhibitor YacG [Edaphobacter aggregans]|uniref:DNA gyrase inhibitor YacG n=1 Tax=Edaphobacter aggregans TaxID=570835 RepID=UPI00055677BA|nr:DNA gyrase inhibitor YacG [Edaphobacter aggregans]
MPKASTSKTKDLRCPTCRTLVLVGSEDFPFCSDRCRLIDLGKWASGDYKVSTPIQDPDLLEELSRSQRNKPNGSDED